MKMTNNGDGDLPPANVPPMLLGISDKLKEL